MYYEKNYARIGVNTNDDRPLDKPLKFPWLTIIIRYIFQNGKKLCPKIYWEINRNLSEEDKNKKKKKYGKNRYHNISEEKKQELK